MAATEIRERRRTLRYRHLLVRQMVQMKNRVSGLLMETGVSHNKQRLHKVGYFPELLANADAVSSSIRPLLQLSRESITRLQRTEGAIIRSLQRDPLLAERVRRLQTIPAVGKVTALSWALEMGDISRFRSIRQAISYCGLCGDEKRSADKGCKSDACRSPTRECGERSEEQRPKRASVTSVRTRSAIPIGRGLMRWALRWASSND